MQYDVTVITGAAEQLGEVAKVVESHGKLVQKRELGQRTFVYPINKQKTGFYGVFTVEVAESAIGALTKALNAHDHVLRVAVRYYKPVTLREEKAKEAPHAPVETAVLPVAPAAVAEVMPEEPKEVANVEPKPRAPTKAKIAKATIEKPAKKDEISEAERLKILDEKLKALLEE